MEVPSHPKYINIVRDMVYKLALQHGFSAAGAYDMKIITGESLSNVIKHAYLGRKDRPIFIELLIYKAYVELRIQDYGVQTPVGKNLMKDLSDYRERGLGLFLISKLSDYHFYDQSLEVGNCLTVKKRIC